MNTTKNKVGIFMKVYRNEPTIHRAIKSVLNQSYKNFKYYLMVNKNTRSIVEAYGKKDRRIVIINGKSNESFRAYAKNIANENEYITTIDADDWYDRMYIEELLSAAEINNADIVACGNYFMGENNKIIGVRAQKSFAWEQKDINEVLPFIYGHFRTIWGKLYRASIFLQSNFENLPKSNEYGGYGGDTLFVYNLFPNTRKFCIIDKNLYYYQVSQTCGTKMLNKGRLDSDEILFNFIENILNKFEGYGDNQRRFLFQVYGYGLIDTVKVLFGGGLSEKEILEKMLYILEKPLSKELFIKEDQGDLFISGFSKSIEFAGTIKNSLLNKLFSKELIYRKSGKILKVLEILYPKLEKKIDEDEFGLLVDDREMLEAFIARQDRKVIKNLLDFFSVLDSDREEMCFKLLRKLDSNIIFKTMLCDKEYLKIYLDIAQQLNREKYEEAITIIKSYFLGNVYPNKAEELVALWNNIAAKLENVEEYIFSLQLKTEILYLNGKTKEAISQFIELNEMNIGDEYMNDLRKMIWKEEQVINESK